MLHVAVCDDNKEHLQESEKLIKEIGRGTKLRLQLFDNADSLLSEINKDRYYPDIAVLDIKMNGEDGISLAKKINVLVPHCKIIFLTSYLQYAQDVYEADHVAYVLKRDAVRYFPGAWEKAVRFLQQKDYFAPGLVIREKGISFFIPLDQILYLSKVNRKAQITCIDREYYDTRRPAVLIPESLEPFFIHCHQSYWVNMKMIKALDHDEFVLMNGVRIPISRSYREDAKKQFFEKHRQFKSQDFFFSLPN